MATQCMKLDNTAFLIEKLASDCAPLQFVRELTSNSLQAIQARRESGWAGDGRIIWDVDWAYLSIAGAYKLQISDNGTGMKGPEIEKYINHLSSSGRIQDFAKNFGLGAKITGCVSNPAGLNYKSWVDGNGVLASLWKDPEVGYGLRQLELGDGKFSHYAPLTDEAKPNPIDECGTAVVLMGTDAATDHTFMPPSAKNKWLVKYLNDRYFEFPAGITVQVRNFQQTERDGWPTSSEQKMGKEPGSQMRQINGMKVNLDKVSSDKGVVLLPDAKVHWWLLPEHDVEQKDIWESMGHCAALYQGELYEFQRLESGRSKLKEFGILFGQRRVVIYAEPDEKLGVYANTARSALLANGNGLPWKSWAADFRDRMPQPLELMMEGISSKSGEKDFREAIKKRLKEMKGLKISRYRRTSTGSISVGGEQSGGGSGESDSSGRSGSSASGSRGGSKSNLYAAFIKPDGEPGDLVNGNGDIPSIQWVSIANLGREIGELEDRAASYDRASNLIKINKDFRVFIDLLRYCAEQYNEESDSKKEGPLQDVVEEWIAQQLVEAVVGVLSLQGSLQWGNDHINAALSEEALTTAVLPRYNMLRTINRALSARFGKNSVPNQ